MVAAGAEGTALTPGLDADPDVRLVFTGRTEGNVSLRVGDDDALAAREVALARIGATPDDAVFAEQVHGARVARVGAGDRGRGMDRREDAVAGVDALVTDEVGVALCVQVADCVPVALVVPGRAVAAVHAGRSGVAAGVVGASVAALADVAGTAPGDVVAVIGPAIGGCCYEVPDELAVEMAAVVPRARTRTRWGTPSVDLPEAVAWQLRAAGVQNVDRVGGCTRHHPDRWFSHRAHTAGVAEQGRQLLAIRRTAPARAEASRFLQSAS